MSEKKFMNSSFRMMVIEGLPTHAFKPRMLIEERGWRVFVAEPFPHLRMA